MGITTVPAGGTPAGVTSLDHYGRLKPGPSQTQLEVIASQRARLQRAIIELAARDGIDAVTVRRLTKLARVSTSAFYSRFSGTDDCLLTAYGAFMTRAVRSVLETRSPELAPADQLEQALRALLAQLLVDRDVSRFALIEIYGGGPTAVAAITDAEGRLASALRECIDRRGRRVPKVVATAIIAAVLHCARTELMEAPTAKAATTIDALVQWALDVVEQREDFGIPGPAKSQSSTLDRTWASNASDSRERNERDLIEATILRLAVSHGFRGLDPRKVSSASGLPAARFRRHFATLADGYLAAIRRTSGSFFAELTAHKGSAAEPGQSIWTALHQASRRAAADPAAARLTFRQVIEPGIAGLTCREALISELAVACIDERGLENRSMRIRAEARIAALWETLAQAAQSA